MRFLDKNIMYLYEKAIAYPAPSIYYGIILSVSFWFYNFVELLAVKQHMLFLATGIIVYYVISTAFYVNFYRINEYNESLKHYLEEYFIILLPLGLELFLRIDATVDNTIISAILAILYLGVLAYSRSYNYLEEFTRLTSSIVMIGLQHYLQASITIWLLSLLVLVLLGRIGMQLVISVFLRQEILEKTWGIDLFYFFLVIYAGFFFVRSKKITGILFNWLVFLIVPNLLLYFCTSKTITIVLFFSIFLFLILVSSTVYHAVVSTPTLSVFLLERLMKKYPYSFQNHFNKIYNLVEKENYYIVVSDAYLMFNNQWLVKKYMNIRMDEAKNWAKIFLEEYKAKFINREEYIKDLEEDVSIIEELENVILTGNYIGKGKYNKAVEKLHDNAVSSNIKEKIFYIFDKEDELNIACSQINLFWKNALIAFESVNKEKGLRGESLLRSPGSALTASRFMIQI